MPIPQISSAERRLIRSQRADARDPAAYVIHSARRVYDDRSWFERAVDDAFEHMGAFAQLVALVLGLIVFIIIVASAIGR